MERQNSGHVVQIQGGVVDVEFPAGELPDIYEAVEISLDGGEKLILEVQKHLPNNSVRTISMGSTDGLQRGVLAQRTGAPIMVPVGQSTLGRIFNVLGEAVDGKGAVEVKQRYPIHRPAPSFEEQSTRVEVF